LKPLKRNFGNKKFFKTGILEWKGNWKPFPQIKFPNKLEVIKGNSLGKKKLGPKIIGRIRKRPILDNLTGTKNGRIGRPNLNCWNLSKEKPRTKEII